MKGENGRMIGRKGLMATGVVLFMALVSMTKTKEEKSQLASKYHIESSQFRPVKNVKVSSGPNANLSTPSAKKITLPRVDNNHRPTAPKWVRTLKTTLGEAREDFFEKLRLDYGTENFEGMFMTMYNNRTVTRGRTLMVSPTGEDGPSWNRLVRKIMKKIILAKIGSKTVPFVWGTGGHSAAAGHGNLYNQSYTANMERNGRSIFASVGLDFVGKNYAMGGTPSGTEIASCSKEIFGKDIDVLSWDFGMTDGPIAHRMELYFYRAFGLPSRPAFVAMQVGQNPKRTISVGSGLEERGMTILYKDEKKLKDMDEAIPDTLGKTQAEIDAMPKFIRSYKCGNAEREKGDPTCDAEKWTNTNDIQCERRKFRTGWHPGWKWHALHGNLNVLFLLEIIEDALAEIEGKKLDPESLLAELEAQEDVDYKLYLSSEVPEYSKEVLRRQDQKDLDIATIYKAPNFCHTARLPAEIRHMGILTESSATGFLEHEYDKGMEREKGVPRNLEGLMPLVYDESMRQNCYLTLQMDYKDYFFVHRSHERGGKLVLPNAAEQRYYGTGTETKGIVATCFVYNDWGRSPKGDVYVNEFLQGKASIHVNGVPVTNLTEYGDPSSRCFFFKHKDGHYWKKDGNNQYEIAVEVLEPGDNYMRFSSFIIW